MHELTFAETGVAEMFTVDLPAWHNEGHVLVNAPTFDEAMALAGLGFTVEKMPVEYVRPILNAAGERTDEVRVESKMAYVVVRTDTYVELGHVGSGYKPIQNADAFRALEPLLDTGVLTLETGGSLREGADCWLMGRFDLDRFGPMVNEVFAGELIPYVLVTTNHSGRRKARVQLTPIRVVCANTLGASESMADLKGGGVVEVGHTGEAVTKMVEAAESLVGGIIERYEVLARHFKALKRSILSDAEFKALVLDVATPDPREAKKFNPEAKLAELVVSRHEARVAEITRLWTGGKGHTGDRSAWEAYNAVVEAVDHNAELFPNRGGTFRTQSLLDGKLAAVKDGVLANLATNARPEYDALDATVTVAV